MSEADKKDSFIFQPVGSRAAVVAAGPIANFVLAIAIFAGIFMTVGKQTTSARVDTVQPDSAARGGRLPARRSGAVDQWRENRQLLRHAAHRQHQCRRNADDRGRARRMHGHAQGDAAAQGAQGQFRQRPSSRRARHQPLDGAWRHQDGEGRSAPGRRHGCAGNLVRGRPDAVLHQREYLPAARRPTSSAGRSASPRFRARWRPPDLRR